MISASRNTVICAPRVVVVDRVVITPHVAGRRTIVNLWRGHSMKYVVFHQRIGTRKTLNPIGNRSRVLCKKEVVIPDAGQVGIQKLNMRFRGLLRGYSLDPASLTILNFD